MDKPPRVLQLTAINSACEQWRVWWPSTALRRLGYTVDYVPFEAFREIFTEVQAGKYDIIVTPRYVWTTISVKTQSGKRQNIWSGDAWRKQVKQYNLTWVYEADDDLWTEPSIERMMQFNKYETRVNQKLWRERYTRYRQDRIRISQFVDGFTVATEPLANVVRQYTTAPVYMVPNAIDVPSWQQLLECKQRTIGPVTIGWAGGMRDEADLKILGEAWHAVAEQCPEVRFIVFGHQSRTLIKSVPKSRLTQIYWCDMEDYPSQLINFDIGCCALEDVEWNNSKSLNKFYEYSMAGAASVVSPTVYSREVTHGTDGLIASTVEEWVEALTLLVRNDTFRTTTAKIARAKVLREHTTHQTAHLWMDAWTKIVEHARTTRLDRQASFDTPQMATT